MPENWTTRAQREKLRQLMAIRNKLSKDPIQVFQPNEIQDLYLKSQARCRMLHGINQGGKSTVASIEQRYYLTCTHPYRPTWKGAEFFCLVPSKDQARKIYGKYLLQESEIQGSAEKFPILDPRRTKVTYVQGGKAEDAGTPKVIKDTITGCSLEFFWSDWSGTLKKMRGMRFAGGWIDEDGGTVALMNELHPRLAKAQDRYPGGGFCTWVVTECGVNQAQEEFLSRCLDESPEYEDWVEWAMQLGMKGDPISDKAREATALAMSEREAKIRMHGTASAAEFVKIFPFLKDREKYILSEPYVPTKKDNIIVAMDQGIDHPTAIVIGHMNETSPKRIVITQAIELIGEPLKNICDAIVHYLRGRRMRFLIYDKHHDKRDWELETFSDKLWEQLDDPDLWVDVNGSHGPWITTVAQDHITSIATMQNFFCPPASMYPEPMLVFDHPNASNGILMCYGQLSRWRGRQDADYEGPQGIYKKGTGDDFCDAVRMLVNGAQEWRDFGWNLPDAVFVPDSYEMPEKQEQPKLSEEELAAKTRQLASAEMAKQVAKGKMDVFSGEQPSSRELKMLWGRGST